MNPIRTYIRYFAMGMAFTVMSTLVTTCQRGSRSPAGEQTAIRITFHDTQVDGSTVARIDMNVIETQIIDTNDTKTVISNQPHAFDLLALTQNNPVVLAHTSVTAGFYKQIRLILDDKTTITLTDGSVHPLQTPSGEQTGIKIDGLFQIPEGKLYTLDIDLDPGKSVHFAPGSGYVLKPVIALTGSDPLVGSFFYAGTFDGNPFVLRLNNDGTTEGKYSIFPDYIVAGRYIHDGVNQVLTVYPEEIRCPSCLTFDTLPMALIGDVGSQETFSVKNFGADFIDLIAIEDNNKAVTLFRVPTFDFPTEIPAKKFTLTTTLPDPALAGKTIVMQLTPEDGVGKGHYAVATIPPDLKPQFPFSIPKTEFGAESKNYFLVMVVVQTAADLTLSFQDGRVDSINKTGVLAYTVGNPILGVISRDTTVDRVIDVPFLN